MSPSTTHDEAHEVQSGQPIIPVDPATEPGYTKDRIELAEHLMSLVIEGDQGHVVADAEPLLWVAYHRIKYSEAWNVDLDNDLEARCFACVCGLEALRRHPEALLEAVTHFRDMLSRDLPFVWPEQVCSTGEPHDG